VVRRGEVWTSTGDSSFRGITQAAGMVVRETDMTLAQVCCADEAFVTGTPGGVTPVTRIDGRGIGSGTPGALTGRIRALYEAAVYPA